MIQIILPVLILFYLGTIFASFINVIRVRGWDFTNLLDRSKCDSCKKELTIQELFPIFSFLYQKGKCISCKSSIPIHNLLMEVSLGLLFVLSYLLAPPESLIPILFISVFILPIILLDIERMEIDMNWVIPMGVSVLIYVLITSPYNLIVAIAFALPFFILSKIKKSALMGEGDFYIALVLGLVFTSYSQAFTAFVLTFWFPVLYLFFFIIYKKFIAKNYTPITLKSQIPLAPFIIVACYFVYFTNFTF